MTDGLRPSHAVMPRQDVDRGWLQRLARARSGWLWLLLTVFAVHVLGRHSDYTLLQGALAGACAVLTVAVILNLFRANREVLPVLAWVFAQFYVFWIVPIFMEGEATDVVSYSILQRAGAIDRALASILVFMLTVLAGSWLVTRFAPSRVARGEPTRGYEVVLAVLGVIALVVRYQVMWEEQEVAAHVYILSVLFSPQLFLLFLIYERTHFRVARWFNVYFYLYVVAAVVVGLLSSRLEFALLPIALVILTSLSRVKRPRLVWILPFLALLVVAQPAKILYRDSTGFRTRYFEQLSLGEGLRIFGDSIGESWGGRSRDVYSDNLQSLADRLNELTKIGAVFYTVPSIVDFDGGKTWAPVLHGLVPRVFWKQKPVTKIQTNDYFNIKLGFQEPHETWHTTASMPLIAESYFNAGWPGIIGIGLVCGLMYGLLAWAFDPTRRLFYVGVYFVVVELRATEGIVVLFNTFWKPFLFAFFWILLLRLVHLLLRGRAAHSAG